MARLCELCVSAVNNRSLIIKTQVFESAKSSLCVLCELCALCGENRKPQGLVSRAHACLNLRSWWSIIIVILKGNV